MLYHNNEWVGPFGRYVIPAAIVRLAERANQRVGLPFFGAYEDLWSYARFVQSPGWRVIEEWGKWRDEQAAAEWDSQKH